ncbi:hypothetical protein SLS58_007173 [Diplodia intermedia]|uniref:Uncharacterized protein n=1 Tax=Diplodia intermedia TaxID=856260 RepID=A0ABR3TLI2_9PEZI
MPIITIQEIKVISTMMASPEGLYWRKSTSVGTFSVLKQTTTRGSVESQTQEVAYKQRKHQHLQQHSQYESTTKLRNQNVVSPEHPAKENSEAYYEHVDAQQYLFDPEEVQNM